MMHSIAPSPLVAKRHTELASSEIGSSSLNLYN